MGSDGRHRVQWVSNLRWPTTVRRQRAWPGLLAMTVGFAAAATAQAVAAWSEAPGDRGVMIATAAAVALSLLGTAAGADTLLLAVSSRRLFFSPVLLGSAVLLILAAVVHALMIPAFGSFDAVMASGRVTAGEVAGIGAIGDVLGCLAFAAVASLKARRATAAANDLSALGATASARVGH